MYEKSNLRYQECATKIENIFKARNTFQSLEYINFDSQFRQHFKPHALLTLLNINRDHLKHSSTKLIRSLPIHSFQDHDIDLPETHFINSLA